MKDRFPTDLLLLQIQGGRCFCFRRGRSGDRVTGHTDSIKAWSGASLKPLTAPLPCLYWWCHGSDNHRLCVLRVQYRLFSMSKSGPLEQMVLEAGDQPFSHLNLDRRAHHSPAWTAMEESFASGKTRGCSVAVLYLQTFKTEKIIPLHNY